MILAQDVGFTFSPGGPLVLEGIDLRVERGEWVALVGRNGSGKSTLAKLLNGLLLPATGRVTVEGLDTSTAQAEIRRRVGMVFQNPDNQIVAARVDEDVAFGPANLGLPAPELRHRVEEALRFVGLWEERTRAPHELSGGQKQRLAIAGVLAMHSDYLVLDEPTSMLDPLGRAEVLREVGRLCRERGLGIVFVTHYAEEASFADRVVVLEAGRLVLAGSPREIYAQAERWYLEVPPMVDLARRLEGSGLLGPEPPLTPEEMAVVLRGRLSGEGAI